MTTEQYEEEAAKIANEDLAYYLQHYGAKVDDPKLQKLYDSAKKALDEIETYFESKGVSLSDY
jgi:hypothetical protein